MNENEELSVKLTADASKYLQVLEEARKKTEASGNQIAKSLDVTKVKTKEVEAAKKELQKTMDRGKSITDKYLTSEERRVKTQNELNHLLKAGAINQETYSRAIAATTTKIDQFNNRAGKIDKFGREFKGMIGDFKDLGLSIAVLGGSDSFSNLLGLTQAQKDMVQLGGATLLATSAIAQLSGSIGELVGKTRLLAAAGLAVKGALVAGIVAGGAEILKSLTGYNAAIEEFDKTKQKSMQLNQVWTDKFLEGSNKILDSVNEIPDEAKKMSEISKQLGKAQAEVKGYEKGVKSATDTVSDMRKKHLLDFSIMADTLKDISSIDIGRENLNFSDMDKRVAAVNLELKDHAHRLDIAKGRVTQLEQAWSKLRPPDPRMNPEVVKVVKELTDNLDLQRKTFGMTANEISIYKAKLAGASDEMLVAARNAGHLNTVLSESRDVVNRFKAIVDNLKAKNVELDVEMKIRGFNEFERSLKLLEPEIGVMKKRLEELKLAPEMKVDLKEVRIEAIKTKAEIERLQTQMAIKKTTGVGPEGLEGWIELHSQELDKLNQKIQRVTAVRETIPLLESQIKLAEAAKINIERNAILLKSEEKKNQLLERGAELTKQFMTPLQKYQESVKELNKLLRAGTISQGTFDRGMEDAVKKMEEAEKQTKKTRQEFEKFDAALFNSAEGAQRVEQFVEKMRDQFEEIRKMEEERAKAVPDKRPVIEKAIEEAAIKRVRETLKELDKLPDPIEAPEPRPVKSPPVAPMPRRVRDPLDRDDRIDEPELKIIERMIERDKPGVRVEKERVIEKMTVEKIDKIVKMDRPEPVAIRDKIIERIERVEPKMIEGKDTERVERIERVIEKVNKPEIVAMRERIPVQEERPEMKPVPVKVIPGAPPEVRGIEPPRGFFNVSNPSNNMINDDRAAMIKLLASIDGTLGRIEDKPGALITMIQNL